MQIYIGADHRGYKLRDSLTPWITSLGHQVSGTGNIEVNPADDFPDIAFRVCDLVVSHPGSLGILICGSGGGMTIAANKVKGIRAAEGFTTADVSHNRNHNDINILTIGAELIDSETAKQLISVFINTRYYPEERFVRRINKIKSRES
jgi:ribose 5-phosphate isomerase B